MATPRYLRSSSDGPSPRYDVMTSSTWPPVADVVSPRGHPDYPASPRQRRTRRETQNTWDAVISPTLGAARWRRGHSQTSPPGRLQPPGRLEPSPKLSPKLRASPIAIGAGRAAVGFLRGCANDAAKEGASWSCLNGRDSVWAAGEGMEIVDVSPNSAQLGIDSTLFGEKDIVVPTISAKGSERPLNARLRRRALMSFLNIKEDSDRCSCCSKCEYWVCFDIFCAMDRSKEGAVRRGDFVWALSAHGACVEFQRVIRRARLSAYFKSTAREISFEEFSQRIFPHVSPSDSQKMQRWISMRKAQRILTSDDFRAQEEQLQEVFALLEEERGCGSLHLVDLIRAQILSKEEILDLVPESQGPEINFEEFCRLMRPSLELKAAGSIEFFSETFKALCKDGLHSKLEAIHQENVMNAVLVKTPKSTPKSDATAKRSPRTQPCGTDSDQSAMSESTFAPSWSSISSDM